MRETLNAGLCDLIPGVGAGLEMLAATEPYYNSTYVALTRADRPAIASFDDPRLRSMKIGVQMIGDDSRTRRRRTRSRAAASSTMCAAT